MRRRHLAAGDGITEKAKKVKMAEEADDSDYDEDIDVQRSKDEAGFFPVKGQPGLFYKASLTQRWRKLVINNSSRATLVDSSRCDLLTQVAATC